MKVIKQQDISHNCFVCGIHNNLGLNARFYELGDGRLCCRAVAKNTHQSYPGRVHGGVTAALLDESIGRAIMITEPDIFGVTVEISVQYKKPVSYDVELQIFSQITTTNRRWFEGVAELILPNGETAATATARFIKMPIEKITGDQEEYKWVTPPSDEVSEIY